MPVVPAKDEAISPISPSLSNDDAEQRIARAKLDVHGFSFVQISDSHIGFDKPANPNALGTLEEAIAKVDALRTKPAFMIHTGDITRRRL
jgi:hypothetical protein